MANKVFIAGKKYTPAELMAMAIEESHNSLPEHSDKTDPLVGAIITTKEGEIMAMAHRGELREGEHCEYTLIERKLANVNLRDCVLYVTLEPCTDNSRKNPKRGCSTHITKARLSKVYIGVEDPNPKIAKEGIKFISEKGIDYEMFPRELQEIIWKDNDAFIKEKELEALQAKKETTIPQLGILEQTVAGSGITSFSEIAINHFIKESKAKFTYPSSEFNIWAHDFGFIEKKELKGKYIPTGLGIMVFGSTPENIFPQTIFKVEINYGKGETEVKNFKGPLVIQLPEIIEYVKSKGLKMTMDKSSGKREDIPDFPFEILLEAIANAVIHRDYSIDGATNYLYIDPNKIIVRSPGELVYPLTLGDLQHFDAPSLSRNPKIMYIFNQMDIADQRGIGLRNMKHLPEDGFPLPTFRMKAGMLEITFGRTNEFIAEKAGLIDVTKLTDEDKAGLLFIQQKDEVSKGEFAAEFGLNDKAAQRRLAKLVGLNLIEMTGSKRGSRYRAIK
jgi:ATP-dependent DNA helicase RecG